MTRALASNKTGFPGQFAHERSSTRYSFWPHNLISRSYNHTKNHEPPARPRRRRPPLGFTTFTGDPTFVNAYATFFYTAFFKQMQSEQPGAGILFPSSKQRLFECQVDQTGVPNCMFDLR